MFSAMVAATASAGRRSPASAAGRRWILRERRSLLACGEEARSRYSGDLLTQAWRLSGLQKPKQSAARISASRLVPRYASKSTAEVPCSNTHSSPWAPARFARALLDLLLLREARGTDHADLEAATARRASLTRRASRTSWMMMTYRRYRMGRRRPPSCPQRPRRRQRALEQL